MKTNLDTQWDDFVVSSPNGTAFIFSDYLNALNANIDSYYCYKNEELMGALLCIVDDKGNNVTGHDYVVYDGLIYRDLSYLNTAQQSSEQFKIQQFVANKLESMYQGIQLSLHPSVNDIRPFLWHNYGEINACHFTPDVRYTSYLDISDFRENRKLSDIKLYIEASVSRRQEIRYAIKKNVKTEVVNKVDQFILFYRLTMSRQGLTVEEAALGEMKVLLDALLKKNLIMIMQSSNQGMKVGSMAVFLLDGKMAYYLFGASDPEMRREHTGTAVLWDSFFTLSNKGFKHIDLEGVNSPLRGWFKLSFGGSRTPYYALNNEVI